MQQHTIFINQPIRQMKDINAEVVIGPSPIEIYFKKKAEALLAEQEATPKQIQDSSDDKEVQQEVCTPVVTEDVNQKEASIEEVQGDANTTEEV